MVACAGQGSTCPSAVGVKCRGSGVSLAALFAAVSNKVMCLTTLPARIGKMNSMATNRWTISSSQSISQSIIYIWHRRTMKKVRNDVECLSLGLSLHDPAAKHAKMTASEWQQRMIV